MIFINILIQISSSTVVGIDLGSDSIKVAVGSRNIPVHPVRNLYSNELTPNVFAYQDNSHWAFGEGAVDQCLLFPDKCIRNQRVPLNDQYYFPRSTLKGYQIVALSLAQIIQSVKDTEHINDEIKVVIAIPPSMTNREKSFLYAALQVAGINCVQFVTSSYVPIETYVNQRSHGNFYDGTALIVDIGHEGVRVSGFQYDNTKITQKFGLYDDKLGGKSIDENLLKMVIAKYDLKLRSSDNYDNDIEYQRNRLLLLSRIRKSREQLTINLTSTFKYKNTKITLTREDIEESCTEIKDILNQIIQFLKGSHPNLLKSGIVHLIGGCTRIPCLQRHLLQLLPGFQLAKSMNPFSAVCMGCCYLLNDETQSKYQIHDALVTTEVMLKTGGEVYKLFSYENFENFNPIVRLNNVDPHQLFQVVDDEKEFIRFTINDLKGSSSNTVDIGFSLNYFLMPVPDKPNLVNEYGNSIQLSVNYEKVGWEVSDDEVSTARMVSNSLIDSAGYKFTFVNHLNDIDTFKAIIQDKVKTMSFWKRKIVFPYVCHKINKSYKSCLKKFNNNKCPEHRIKSILDEFRSSAKYHFNIDLENDEDDFSKYYYNDDNNDDNFYNDNNYRNVNQNHYRNDNKNYRQESKKSLKKFDTNTDKGRAMNELYNLINDCKAIGAKCDDAEKWLNSKGESSTLRELYEYIGILKERRKSSEDSFFHNL